MGGVRGLGLTSHPHPGTLCHTRDLQRHHENSCTCVPRASQCRQVEMGRRGSCRRPAPKTPPSHGRQQAAQGRWQATGTSSKGVVELVLFLELSPIPSPGHSQAGLPAGRCESRAPRVGWKLTPGRSLCQKQGKIIRSPSSAVTLPSSTGTEGLC